MQVDRVISAVRGVPFMSVERGTEIYRHIVEEGLTRVLELGFAHGVSTCYFAAAVDETDGHVVTMDRRDAVDRSPNLWTLGEGLDLMGRITPVLAEKSFTWELMKILRDTPETRFDFVYIDGGHTWDVSGFAFLLVDRLVDPGGWILFDDLDWTIRSSPSVSEAGFTEEEAITPQVSYVFDLLVEPTYDTRRDRGVGWARKR